MSTPQHITNPLFLPDGLPVPEDDGAADHLVGAVLPDLALIATTGETVSLAEIKGRAVVYAYPMTGVPDVALPDGWNDIPGARGCTPQTLAFQTQTDAFAGFGVPIYGLSTQTPAYQNEMATRLGLTFPVLSDSEFMLTDALGLPTMTVDGMRLIKRITLIIRDGAVEHFFYPVFPPNRAASETLAWLQDHTDWPDVAGVMIYSQPGCEHCQAAKAILNKQEIQYVDIDIARDPEAAKVMAARTGASTVPQIIIGSKHVGGAQELLELADSGALAELLTGAKA